jgi:hypothetical protein
VQVEGPIAAMHCLKNTSRVPTACLLPERRSNRRHAIIPTVARERATRIVHPITSIHGHDVAPGLHFALVVLRILLGDSPTDGGTCDAGDRGPRALRL